jgi:hypothetical protein
MYAGEEVEHADEIALFRQHLQNSGATARGFCRRAGALLSLLVAPRIGRAAQRGALALPSDPGTRGSHQLSHFRRKVALCNVLEAYPFKYLTQTGPESDPHILQVLGRTLVLDRLGPQACARGPSSARMTSATVTSDGGLPRLYPASRPRWLTSIPARRKSFKMTPRNLLGICWSAAMASTVMGSEAVAKTSNARTP